jgi:glycosyltransferase involved in cell wall biosynthesis
MNHDKKMHVVHVTQFLEIGGLESFIVEFCRNADKNRLKVSVLCLNGCDDAYRSMLEERDVQVYLLKKNSKYDIGFFFRVSTFLKSKQVDILHAHGGCFFYTAVIGLMARVKGVMYTAHGLPVRSGLQEHIEEYVSAAISKKIIAVSDEVAADLKGRLKNLSGRVEVIINGVDTNKFSNTIDPSLVDTLKDKYGLPKHKKIIGTVGRIETVKNYPMLIKAFHELITEYTCNAHLVFVGSGCQESELKVLVEHFGINEHVSFLGMQYDLPLIYPLFDLFSLSSITEGTSLSLLEAQSCGIPAVVTDVGGNPLVVQHGVNGYLCPLDDYKFMAKMLADILSDDTLHINMENEASRLIRDKFSLNGMLDKYYGIYESILMRQYLII